MTGHIQARFSQDPVDFESNQGNIAGALGVGRRRKETDEPLHGAGLAVSIEDLDPDLIEMPTAMNGRVRVGFRDDQRRLGFRDLARLGIQRDHRGRHARIVAADPEPGSGYGPQAVDCLVATQLVFAIAKEREVIVGEPVQEVARFV